MFALSFFKNFFVNQILKLVFQQILGSKKDFQFRERLFHALCVFMIFPISQIIIQNIAIGLYALILPWSFVFLYLLMCYSISRYFKKFELATVLFGIGTLFIMSVNYIYNDGINGPTMIGSFIPMTLLFVISNTRLRIIWALLYALVFGQLFYLEFNNTDFIKPEYLSEKHRYLDVYGTYVFSLISVFMIAWFTQTSLKNEQRKTKQQSEKLKKERYALRQSNSQLNKLFSIISHDLRKPLGNIISYLDLLDDDMLNDREKELIKQDLYLNTKNTHQLLENLLNWSRAQENGFNFSPSKINFHDLLFNTLSISKDLAKPKNISILASYDTNTIVKADKSLVEIIIRNLLQNAIKFSPENSTIWFNAEIKDNQLAFQIIDEGDGLKDFEKEQIKKKATDLSWHSTKNNHGLGLHLCVMCASTHNGYIEAFDNPKGGTIMKFTIGA